MSGIRASELSVVGVLFGMGSEGPFIIRIGFWAPFMV